LKFDFSSGSTPIDDEVARGLIPSWISIQSELNAVEQANILEARNIPRWQALTSDKLLDDLMMRNLHRDMYGDVWRWAGKYRSRDLNIGIAFEQVATRVKILADDTREWITGS
jgi:fido (protein-threonine AMPylation protein)